jgi:hypothetical protein
MMTKSDNKRKKDKREKKKEKRQERRSIGQVKAEET